MPRLARWARCSRVLLNSQVPLLTALGQANQTLRRRACGPAPMLALAEVRGGKALSQRAGRPCDCSMRPA